MHGLRDALEQSQKDGAAIGHFNVADWVLLKAVLASSQELKVPVHNALSVCALVLAAALTIAWDGLLSYGVLKLAEFVF